MPYGVLREKGLQIGPVMAATMKLAHAQSARQANSLQALPFVHWALLYIIAVSACFSFRAYVDGRGDRLWATRCRASDCLNSLDAICCSRDLCFTSKKGHLAAIMNLSPSGQDFVAVNAFSSWRLKACVSCKKTDS